MKRKNIYLAVVILLVLSLGLLLVKKFNNLSILQKKDVIESANKKEIHPSLAELEVIENSSIDKSDWQTYKNDYYGFEIKAPKSWNIKQVGKSENFDNSGVADMPSGSYLAFQPTINDSFYAPLNMYVEDNKDNLSINDWFLKKYINYKVTTKGFISFNIPTAEEAIAMPADFINNEVIYNYYLKKGNKIFNFNLSDSGSDVKSGSVMMNAIIKTIRFK